MPKRAARPHPRAFALALAPARTLALTLGLSLPLALALPSGCAHAPAGAATSASAPAEAPPIPWRGWERAAFAEAAAAGKPILVTVVAGWCHWCHVMDEETYSDPRVAALLAERFVTIRVDADAHPDLAERYAAWGWPAIAFLSADARPVLELRGYQEADAFAALLAELADAAASGALQGRRPAPATAPVVRPLAAVRDEVAALLDGTYDHAAEGWGHRQKYPLAGPIEHALLRARLRPAEAEWEARALRTLGRELLLVDPVWGGVFQYSTGGRWDRPHYEKIAAVQAGALTSFALAYRRTHDPRWLAALDLEVTYLKGHLMDEAGGFFAAQDADLRGEGGALRGAEFYTLDAAGRAALGEPAVDRRIYADLVGALIVGLCTADAVDDRPPGARGDALALARAAGERLLADHRREDGAFRHQAGVDDPRIYLRDQAAVGRALLALYQSSGERRWLAHARALADRLLAELRDPASGAFFAASEDPAAVGVFSERRRPLEANGEAARFLIDLHRLVDHQGAPPPYLAAAEAALVALADRPAPPDEGRMIASYLLALEHLLLEPVEVTIVAPHGSAEGAALLAAALAADEPRKLIEWSEPGERYPASGSAALYVCTSRACSSPIREAAEVAPRLTAFIASLADT
ncbi:MAG: thioredoxin domain-containing protein [Myxococcales bacterium]|nr:thioredoxin domain-containing protein [Myxococcales bacterium]